MTDQAGQPPWRESSPSLMRARQGSDLQLLQIPTAVHTLVCKSKMVQDQCRTAAKDMLHAARFQTHLDRPAATQL
jgi:hypothetical protein